MSPPLLVVTFVDGVPSLVRVASFLSVLGLVLVLILLPPSVSVGLPTTSAFAFVLLAPAGGVVAATEDGVNAFAKLAATAESCLKADAATVVLELSFSFVVFCVVFLSVLPL